MFLQSPVAESIFVISVLAYAGFWIWAIIHALQTPKADNLQRSLWVAAMVANPTTAIWYWYVWKKRAFWALFTPVLGAFLSMPLVVRSVLSKSDETVITSILYGLGSAHLVILVSVLMVFPLILRLAALFHLGKNTEISAMDRNDWIVSLALPVFGFGAAIAYCARYRRGWAIAGLCWWLFAAVTLKIVFVNISQALIPAGVERRNEIRLQARPN